MQSFLQWNCRGLRSSLVDLQTVIRRDCPLLVCLQETKLKPEHHLHFKGYSIFRKDLDTDSVAHGGVLVAVSHRVSTRPIPVRSPLQAVAVRVALGHRELTCCSLYCPPGESLPVQDLRMLLAELPQPVLILGDFNSHHSAWGCDSVCTRGRLLASLIDEEGLCVLNTGAATHFTMPSGHSSVLDLSLVSPHLVPLFTWRVDADSFGSDHFPIWLELRERPSVGCRPPRWNLRRADWEKFQTCLEDALSSDPTDDLSVTDFTSLLIGAAKASIPRTSGAPSRRPVPWWSDACRDAIRARKRALRAFRHNCTTANMIAFRKAERSLGGRSRKLNTNPGWNTSASLTDSRQSPRFGPV